jgi:hypothetical protein
MECFQCERPAKGVCRFCGRAVCENHVSKMPYIITVYVGEGNIPKVLVVADALWCGVCKPQPEPIEMPEIY